MIGNEICLNVFSSDNTLQRNDEHFRLREARPTHCAFPSHASLYGASVGGAPLNAVRHASPEINNASLNLNLLRAACFRFDPVVTLLSFPSPLCLRRQLLQALPSFLTTDPEERQDMASLLDLVELLAQANKNAEQEAGVEENVGEEIEMERACLAAA